MKIQSAVMCCLLVAVLITVLITRTEAREETQRKLFLRRQAAVAADIAIFNEDDEPGIGGFGGCCQRKLERIFPGAVALPCPRRPFGEPLSIWCRPEG